MRSDQRYSVALDLRLLFVSSILKLNFTLKTRQKAVKRHDCVFSEEHHATNPNNLLSVFPQMTYRKQL